MSVDTIPGFTFGVVTQNVDPLGLGRIKVELPGILKETPYWVMPYGWTGGSSRNAHGPQPRPPDRGAMVPVIFSHGDYLNPESKAIFLTGFYGVNDDGTSAGPAINASEDTAADVTKCHTLYEDSKFQVYLLAKDDDRKLVMQTKERGTKIEIDATAGEGGNSEVISIEAATALFLYSAGQIDISATQVSINGRSVSPMGGEI